MWFQNIISIIIACLYFYLGVSILFKKDNIKARLLSGLIFCAFIWSSTVTLTVNNIAPSELLGILIKFPHPSVLWILYFLIFFLETLNDKSDNKLSTNKVKLYILTFTNLAFTVISLFTPLIVEGVHLVDDKNNYLYGGLYSTYSIYVFVLILIGFQTLFVKYKEAKGLLRLQIAYTAIGTFGTIAAGLVTNLILPALGKGSSQSIYGPYAALVLISFLYYVTATNRFLSVKNFINKVIGIIVLAAICYFTYYALSIIYISNFGDIFNNEVYLIGIIVSIAFASLISAISNKLNNTTFLRQSNNPQKFLNTVKNKKYIDTTNEEIISDFVYLADKWMGIPQVEVFKGSEINSSPYNQLAANLLSLDSKSNLYLAQEYQDIFLNQKVDEVSAILTIEIEKELEYLLVFAYRSNYDPYSLDDILALENASEQLQLFISRNFIIDKEKNYHRNLQIKVDEATAELQKQKSVIENQYQQERDMMGIIGHELRTPLTIARGNLEYLLKKLQVQTMDDKERLLQKMKDAYNSVKKEAELVQTMLSTSHVDRNKIDLHPEAHNIADLVKQSVNDFQTDAERKKLQLVYVEPTEQVPLVFADPLRMTEVTNNLVSNAVKYTDSGVITAFITQDSDFVYIHVKDTGRGISEENLKSIGKKFFRVENYLDESKNTPAPGGTGLGIYVVKGLLEASGGSLIIESKLGEGSTFTAQLPIYKPLNMSAHAAGPKKKDEVDMFVQLGLKKGSEEKKPQETK